MDIMIKNKKVRNTEKIIIDGIQFRSKLEGICYTKLIEAGIVPNYEKERYILYEGFKPSNDLLLYLPIYKNKKIVGYGRNTSKIQSITYKPDFTFEYNGYKIIIEVKGHPNDAYPNIKKMALKIFEDLTWDLENEVVQKIAFFEPHNIGQINETIEIIKSL